MANPTGGHSGGDAGVDATVAPVTGTNQRVGAGTLLFSAYTGRVQWTGSKIRSARAKRGWTQAQFADELGAGLRTVAAWERGEAKPQAHWIERLNEVFPGEDPGDTAQGQQENPRDPRVSEADFIELLEEIARRYTRARAELPLIGAIDTETDRTSAGEVYEWSASDAPSAHRKSRQSDHPRGDKAL